MSDCIERCLAKNPADRFQSFKQIVSVLEDTQLDAWGVEQDAALNAFDTIYRLHRKRLLGSQRNGNPEDVIFDFPGGRTLSITFGDLSGFHADALVSSDDLYLSMDAGVALALEQAAGPGYHELAKSFRPVRIGRVAVTPAFALNAKYVFHGVTVGVSEKDDVVGPSRDVVAEIVDSCFYHAESLDVETLAFPLLGTGIGHLSRSESLDAMFQIISRRMLRGSSTVSKVTVVLRNSHVHQTRSDQYDTLE